MSLLENHLAVQLFRFLMLKQLEHDYLKFEKKPSDPGKISTNNISSKDGFSGLTISIYIKIILLQRSFFHKKTKLLLRWYLLS